MTKPSKKKVTQIPKKSAPVKSKVFDFKQLQVWFLLIFAIGLYVNTLNYDYVLDDKLMIRDNKFTTAGFKGIKDIFTHESFTGYFGEQTQYVAGGRYRPLSQVFFAIEYELFGLNTFTGHLINILLYALTCIFIFYILKMLFKSDDKKQWYLSIPFITTALFIAHPLHTEVVANIKGRDEIMSLLGSMGALYFTFKYIKTKKNIHLLLTLIVFFAALLSKENAITFLAIIPVTIFVFIRSSVKDYIIFVSPLVVATIIYIYVRYNVLGYLMGSEPINDLLNNPFVYASTSEKFATIFYTWGKYIQLLIIPHPLTHDYYPKQIPIINWADIKAIMSVLIYITLIIYALLTIKKKNVIAYSILFFLFSFSISSNLFFPIGTFMNERFMFVSLLGFVIIIAYFINNKLTGFIKNRKLYNSMAVIVLIIILSGYSIKTISRNTAWKNDYTLNTTDVKVSVNSARCNVVAAESLIKTAREENDETVKYNTLQQAITYLNKALKLHPPYVAAWMFLGSACIELKDYNQAEGIYNKCLKYSPDNPQVYAKLGELYGKHLNNIDKSIEYLTKAYKLNPKDASNLENMGIAYGIKGNYQESVNYFNKALEINPTNPSLHNNVGQTYKSMGLKDKAEEHFTTARKLKTEQVN